MTYEILIGNPHPAKNFPKRLSDTLDRLYTVCREDPGWRRQSLTDLASMSASGEGGAPGYVRSR